MKYEVNKKKYEVVIIRKNNKNTYVRYKDNSIYVTTNFFVTKNQIITLLDNNLSNLEKMILKIDKKNINQDKFLFLGKEYDIIIVPTLKETNLSETYILVKSEQELQKWLKKQVLIIYNQRLDNIYHLFEEKIPYPTLTIRKMTSRWGVCNRVKKRVTLNSELIIYGIKQIDYVIVHELSHFIHFDHSKNFWELVNKYCKEYKIIRKSLKEG